MNNPPERDTLEAVEIERLREIAEQALGHSWSIVPYGDGDSFVIHEAGDWRVCFMATPGDSPGAMERIKANAAHIANFDPPTILRLLSSYATLQANLSQVTAERDNIAGEATIEAAYARQREADLGDRATQAEARAGRLEGILRQATSPHLKDDTPYGGRHYYRADCPACNWREPALQALEGAKP
jgi:hypothetical protein